MGAQHNHKKKQPALTQTTAATPDATDIAPTGPTFVSRGGHKLDHALKEFGLDIRGKLCADLGCSTGGFSDCLLQAGAARVFSVDTAYGILAWKLRKDPRVTVMERTNALHAAIPAGGVDVVVADLSWTPQRLILPVAAKWLTGETSAPRFLISLIKPHYELKDRDANAVPKGGVLPDAEAEQIALGMAEFLAPLLTQHGFAWKGLTQSPIRGGAHGKGKEGTGNLEWVALLERVTSDASPVGSPANNS